MGRLNLTNPVNRKHPLNKGREAWWLALPDSGRFGGASWYDLCGRFHGVFESGSGSPGPGWKDGVPDNGPPSLQFNAGGGGNGWNANCGGGSGLSFTDNFTVGIQFRPYTLDPIDINGLAGLIVKNHVAFDTSWYLRQYTVSAGVGGVQFGGSTQVSSGALLSTSVTSRVVAVMQNGTATLYHQGLPITSASISIGANSSPVRIGVDFLAGPRYFYGWIEEAFVCSRPWTAAEVLLDRQLSLKRYRDRNTPLNFFPAPLMAEGVGADILMTFETGIGTGTSYQNLSPQNFETRLYASGGASGLGELEPDGPMDFTTSVQLSQFAMVAPPVLMPFQTPVLVDYTQSLTSPLEFTTGVGVSHTLTSTIDGNRRIIGSGRYKR